MDPAILTYCVLMLKFQGKGVIFFSPHIVYLNKEQFILLGLFFFNITVALRPGRENINWNV